MNLVFAKALSDALLALTQLVELKDIKDKMENQTANVEDLKTYVDNQPIVWENARRALRFLGQTGTPEGITANLEAETLAGFFSRVSDKDKDLMNAIIIGSRLGLCLSIERVMVEARYQVDQNPERLRSLKTLLDDYDKSMSEAGMKRFNPFVKGQ